jgi:hypothetical protein
VFDDNDPRWELHSGGGAQWPGVARGRWARAAAFYTSLSGSAKVSFDLMVDHPGECLDADWLARHLGRRAAGETAGRGRHPVSGSLSALNWPHAESGRRYRFRWWKGTGAGPAHEPTSRRCFAQRAKPTPIGKPMRPHRINAMVTAP